jgi:hypothetical protein
MEGGLINSDLCVGGDINFSNKFGSTPSQWRTNVRKLRTSLPESVTETPESMDFEVELLKFGGADCSSAQEEKTNNNKGI